MGTSSPPRAPQIIDQYIIMKKNIIIKAALLSIAAVAVYALSFPSEITMESVLGFGIVFALLRGAAMDYRHEGTRSLSR